MNIIVLAALWRDSQGREIHRDLLDKIHARCANPKPSHPPHGEQRTSGVYPSVKAGTAAISQAHVEIPSPGEYSAHDSALLRRHFQRRLMRSDAVIAVVMHATIEFGMKLELAITAGKPILCLQRDSFLLTYQRLSYMVTGSELVTVKTYLENDPGLDRILDEFLEKKVAKAASR